MKYVYSFFAMFFGVFFYANTVFSATMSIQSGGFFDDGSIQFDVYAETGQKAPMNAASAIISLPFGFSFEGVDIRESIFSFWPEKPQVDTASQTLTFSGGSPALGGHIFKSKLLSFVVKPKTHATGTITIRDPHILAHDGNGTDIFSFAEDYSFSVHQAVPSEYDANDDGYVSIKELSVGMYESRKKLP